MPCSRALTGYLSKCINKSGKRSLIFNKNEALSPDCPISIPCGQCRHCRLEHSRQWALRCYHEASLYKLNCFITLTYSDEFLPTGYHLRSDPSRPNYWVFTPAPGSIDPRDPTEFMHRLREKFGPGIRSFGCAEYGELLNRPHYHICLFNFDFSDKVLLKEYSKNGIEDIKLYVSQALQDLWPKGHSTVGALTFESAAYTARYVTKKFTGARAQDHYAVVNHANGEVMQRLPERAVAVSRRPGIGKLWYEKFGQFLRDHDFVYLRGRKMRPAKYYDRLFDVIDPIALETVKESRARQGKIALGRIQEEDRVGYANHALMNAGRPYDMDRPRYVFREEIMEKLFDINFNQVLKRGFEDG